MADIRINEVNTDVNVIDAASLLTPQLRDLIVREVLKALDARAQTQRTLDAERSLGSDRQRE